MESLHLFIIDDDELTLKVVSAILKRKGINVYPFSSAVAALKEVGNNKPDVILLDLVMPEMNGFEFLIALKEKVSSLPKVIIGSGSQSSKDKTRSLELGASDFINKPYEFNELLLRIIKQAS